MCAYECVVLATEFDIILIFWLQDNPIIRKTSVCVWMLGKYGSQSQGSRCNQRSNSIEASTVRVVFCLRKIFSSHSNQFINWLAHSSRWLCVFFSQPFAVVSSAVFSSHHYCCNCSLSFSLQLIFIVLPDKKRGGLSQNLSTIEFYLK